MSANQRNLSFIESAKRGDTATVEALLAEQAVDVNLRAPLGYTALLCAVFNAHNDIVEVLLRAGADPAAENIEGSNALMMAAGMGYADIIETLLNHDVDVNSQNSHGVTALMMAASWRNVNVTRLLLARGADPNIKDKKGKTAWTRAFDRGYSMIVRMLEDAGAIKEPPEPPKKGF